MKFFSPFLIKEAKQPSLRLQLPFQLFNFANNSCRLLWQRTQFTDSNAGKIWLFFMYKKNKYEKE